MFRKWGVRAGPAVAAILILIGFVGCAELDQKRDTLLYRGPIDLRRAELTGLDPSLKYLAEYAALSALVYDDKPADLANCKLDSFLPWRKLSDWSERSYLPRGDEFEHDLKVPGLEYEVWLRGTIENPDRLAIAFRGTDPTEFGDWYSNFRWGTRFIPFVWDQYDQTRALTPGLVSMLKDKFPGVPITATGHSLGGGLAHQAGYMSEEIKEVFAFAPSSVTGYYSIDESARVRNSEGMRIYRIFERGEILEGLRWAMSKVYPIQIEDPQIIELRFSFSDQSAIDDHGMHAFACSLIDQLKSK